MKNAMISVACAILISAAAMVPARANPISYVLTHVELPTWGQIYDKMTSRFARGSCLRS